MKKIRSLILFTGLCASLVSYGQNQTVILAPKSYNTVTGNFSPLPIPTVGNTATPITDPTDPFAYVMDGYDGQAALASQNIIVDNTGAIVFFIVDMGVYDRKGRGIGVLREDNLGIDVPGLMSEVAVVPVPDDCNSYYIITSFDENAPTAFPIANPAYAKVSLYYNDANDLLPGSGLQEFGGNPTNTIVDFEDIIGSTDYNADNSLHNNRPLFAVTEKTAANEHFLFMLNTNRFFRLRLTSAGVFYDNYHTTLDAIYPGCIFFQDVDFRQEMEVVRISTGYRVACPAGWTDINSVPYNGVCIFDLTLAGVVIPGSQKLAGYLSLTGTGGSSAPVIVKGIEFSSNGRRLYVSHPKKGIYTNALEYFDLSTSTPTRVAINVLDADDFQYSQIETAASGALLIPATTRLARITNANIASFPADYQSSILPLTAYNATNPHGIPAGTEKDVRLLQDQIDRMNYGLINHLTYDQTTYSAASSTDVLWEANVGAKNNPLLAAANPSNVVRIRKELIIPAGKTVTIKNMIFKFDPGAKVTIEKNNGAILAGQLILDNTIFTVDDQCKTDMWLGVHVWGNGLYNQALGTSVSGTLITQNNSKIEHAFTGATSYSGGIIRGFNSTYFNNQTGVHIFAYSSPSGADNLCYFEQCTFDWNGTLKRSTLPYSDHVLIENTKGIKFKANTFKNSNGATSSLSALGRGLFSVSSNFKVLALGTSFIPNTFTNLQKGIYVRNFNLTAFEVDRNTFVNNVRGIDVEAGQREIITRNSFKVKESTTQTAGIYFTTTTGYKVEENTFTNFDNTFLTVAAANAFGIVVRNSGTANNLIYRNTFSNLRIGGQSEGLNSGLPTVGLQWRCNVFNPTIVISDLTVTSGTIRHYQGTKGIPGFTNDIPAGNKFSLNNEGLALEHDILLRSSLNVIYVHTSEANYTPDSRTAAPFSSTFPGYVIPSAAITSAGRPITHSGNTCPSTFIAAINPVGDHEDQRTELGSLVHTLVTQLESGDSDALLDLIRTTLNLGELMPILRQHTPYLSDRALLAFMDRKPEIGQLKEILVAHSALSQSVKERLDLMDIPQGTKRQIEMAQDRISPRTAIQMQIDQYKEQIADLTNEIIRDLQLADGKQNELIAELQAHADDLSLMKVLLETYLDANLHNEANALMNDLQQKGASAEYLELAAIKREIRANNSVQEAFRVNPSMRPTLEGLVINAPEEDVQLQAQALLELNDGIVPMTDFEEINNEKSYVPFTNNNTPIESMEAYSFATIYPNPSSGKINIDLPEIEAGKMDIELLDVSGKLIFQTSFEHTNGEILDLSGMTKGIYFVKITIDAEITEIQKLELK